MGNFLKEAFERTLLAAIQYEQALTQVRKLIGPDLSKREIAQLAAIAATLGFTPNDLERVRNGEFYVVYNGKIKND